MFTKAATILALALSVESQTWNNNRCDATAGPAAWSKLSGNAICKGTENSPIDLCGPTLIPPSKAGTTPNYTLSGKDYDTKHALTLKNNGHTLEITEAAPIPVFRVPGLHYLVGRSETTSKVLQDWTFVQMHIHVGRTGNPNEGSDHVALGRRYPAEAHFVHINTARGADLGTALASGKKDAVLIIGVFFELGPPAQESNLIKQIAAKAALPQLTGVPVSVTTQVSFSDVLNFTDTYYAYGGGLTIPPCSQQVTWVFLATPRIISSDSLVQLKTTKVSPTDNIGKNGFFRPLQSLGSRKVYISRNVSSKCTTPTVADPCFTCTAAATAAPVQFNAQTSFADQSAKEVLACSETPAWLLVTIGMLVPTTLIILAVGLFYCISWRRGKAVMTYCPFPRRSETAADLIPYEGTQ